MSTLQEKRANIWEQMKEINDSADGRQWEGEEVQKYDRLEAEYDSLTASIERSATHATRSAVNDAMPTAPTRSAPVPDAKDEYETAFRMFVTEGMAAMDREQRNALRTGFNAMDPREVRAAQGVGTGAAGGYAVPTGFRATIIEKMKAYGAVMDVATVITTDTGAPLPWPTNDDTGNVGALLAENTAAAEQDFVFGSAQLGAYKYTSKTVRESLEFLQDVSWLDAQTFIARKFAERLGRIHNQHFTTGTGTAQPQGIVTGAASGVTAVSATAFTADELIDLQHSVDPAYRNERSKFMLNDAALKAVRKLKDTQGRYIFQSGGAGGIAGSVPDSIVGQPYVINQDMASPATGVKSVLFGDFQAGYIIRVVSNMDLLRLDERFAEFGQVGFIAFDRMDGLVQDNSAYKALTQA